jgi:AAA+ superfamily predicted ATPase
VNTPPKLPADFTHLARIALTGRTQDVQLFLHKAAKKYKVDLPELAVSLTELLREAPTRASPLRRQAETPVPVDTDTRLQLLRIETKPILDHQPVFSEGVARKLGQVVTERSNPETLLKAGLEPTKTLLFTGPPGVGKTMAAKWLATQLNRPLLILDLAAVMSSYLGKTGSNVRYVLDYAKSTDCVLLLDELDAIAKRRDDQSEIGELKRLVTVLIQEIDDWPSSGLLVAATNHSELLDPAIWRRFESVVEFSLPNRHALIEFIETAIGRFIKHSSDWAKALAISMEGKSFSEVEHSLLLARRSAALSEQSIESALEHLLGGENLNKSERIDLAAQLTEIGVFSQRRVNEITKVSRDTIRGRTKASKTQKDGTL